MVIMIVRGRFRIKRNVNAGQDCQAQCSLAARSTQMVERPSHAPSTAKQDWKGNCYHKGYIS